jgi:hypothetical protein
MTVLELDVRLKRLIERGYGSCRIITTDDGKEVLTVPTRVDPYSDLGENEIEEFPLPAMTDEDSSRDDLPFLYVGIR